MATTQNNPRRVTAPAAQTSAAAIVKYVRTPIGDIGLTLQRMRRLEKEYLDEASELRSRVGHQEGLDSIDAVVYEKILSPFQYWLENRCALWARKNMNEKGGFLPKREWTGEP